MIYYYTVLGISVIQHESTKHLHRFRRSHADWLINNNGNLATSVRCMSNGVVNNTNMGMVSNIKWAWSN